MKTKLLLVLTMFLFNLAYFAHADDRDEVIYLRNRVAQLENELQYLRNQIRTPQEMNSLCFSSDSVASRDACLINASNLEKLSTGNVGVSSTCYLEYQPDYRSVCYGNRWVLKTTIQNYLGQKQFSTQKEAF